MADLFQLWIRLTKYRVLVGAVLVSLPLGIPFYYGNMASYSDSYFRYNSYSSSWDIGPEWLLPSFVAMVALGLLSAGFICDRFGLGKTLIGASVLLDVVTFSTYFSVQHSVGLTLITLMVLGGYSVGICVFICMVLAKGWFPGKHQGIAMSIVSSGFGMGAIIYNQLTTTFINPRNLAPDFYEDNVVFFSQPEIIQRFPYVFFAIGGVSILLQVLGLPLVKIPPNYSHIDNKINGDPENKADKTYYNGGYQNTKSEAGIIQHDDEPATELESDVSPLRAFKTINFWLSWLSVFSMSLNYLVVMNYYKTFGEIWIHDDEFLTLIGTTSTFTVTIARILTGACVDQWGIKTTLVVDLAMGYFLMVFWYPSVQAHKLVYLLWTNCLAGITSTIYSIVPLLAVRMFGHRHFDIMYGLLNTPIVVACVTTPPLFVVFVSNIGWFWLFLTTSVLSGCMVILVIVFVK